MPTQTIIFLAVTIIAFGSFAATLAYVEASTRAVTHRNHPLAGE